MPAYSEKKQAEHLERVREVLAIYPRASARQIREVLLADKRFPIALDVHYILKLRGKIESERIKRFDRATIEGYVAKLEDEIEQVLTRAWAILLGAQYDDRARIAAAKIIVDAKLKIFEAKMSAGIFEKHLGTFRVEGKFIDEHRVLVLQALRNFGILKDDGALALPEEKHGTSKE